MSGVGHQASGIRDWVSDLNEAVEHLGDGVALLFDMLMLGQSNVANLKRNHALSHHFSCRASSDIEMTNGLGIGMKFISFGNMAGNTDRCSPNLIPQAKIPCKFPLIGHLINPNCQVLSFFPNFQLLVSRWVESFVERAYGDKTLASVGFCSSTATYIICNLITPAYLRCLNLCPFRKSR